MDADLFDLVDESCAQLARAGLVPELQAMRRAEDAWVERDRVQLESAAASLAIAAAAASPAALTGPALVHAARVASVLVARS